MDKAKPYIFSSHLIDEVAVSLAVLGLVKKRAGLPGEWPDPGSESECYIDGWGGEVDGKMVFVHGDVYQFHILVQFDRPAVLQGASIVGYWNKTQKYCVPTGDEVFDQEFAISATSQSEAESAAAWVRGHAIEALLRLAPVYEFSMTADSLLYYSLDRDASQKHAMLMGEALLRDMVGAAYALEGKVQQQ